MSPRLFSVVTATYNCGAKIARTVRSVLAQDRSLFDYLVVDGGSTDETLAVLKTFGDAIAVVSERDRGVYDALNKGITRSTGTYLYFLGAGDTVRPGAFSRLAPLLPDEDHALVYGDAFCVRTGRIHNGRFTAGDLAIRNLCHQAAFYSRALFERFGTYDLRYPIAADWVFNLMCFSDPQVVVKYVDEVIVDYEGGGLSETSADAAFARDWPALVRERLGGKDYLRYRVYLLRCRLSQLKRTVLRAVASRR
jgi:glycosyltransferase involved in cell wall biosynthesis